MKKYYEMFLFKVFYECTNNTLFQTLFLAIKCSDQYFWVLKEGSHITQHLLCNNKNLPIFQACLIYDKWYLLDM